MAVRPYKWQAQLVRVRLIHGVRTREFTQPYTARYGCTPMGHRDTRTPPLYNIKRRCGRGAGRFTLGTVLCESVIISFFFVTNTGYKNTREHCETRRVPRLPSGGGS